VDDPLRELPAGIELRPTQLADRDFLLQLYAGTRADEMAIVPWSEADKAAFIEQQFTAQDNAYRGTYPAGEFLVVVAGAKPIGRLYLARLEDELRVVDIVLEPAQRGQGAGSRLMEWLIARADSDGLAVTLHVEYWNPAHAWYERLGFATVERRGIYEFMRRPARTQLKTD
jgi:ribosomal protein S18 acetylase RimI-like enzyme